METSTQVLRDRLRIEQIDLAECKDAKYRETHMQNIRELAAELLYRWRRDIEAINCST